MENSGNWKTKALVVGALVGAFTGIIAAMIYIEQAADETGQPKMSTGDGVKVGLGVLGLIRMISDMGHRS